MTLCQACGGTILSPAISGARRGSCHCNRPNTPEEEMAKSKKRAKAQQVEQVTENAAPVAAAAAEPPTAEAPKPEAKVAKVPKPIAFNPQGEVKAAKQGSKLAALIDALATGSTMEQLVKVLSATGSAVDASGVRSWIAYDLKRTGLGVHQDGHLFRLIGTPLPHRDATPKKAQAPKLDVVTEPKQKKAAMTSARSKKAAARS